MNRVESPEFKGQQLGHEPDAYFFERLIDMPIPEAIEELHSARTWAVWKLARCQETRSVSEVHSIQALLSRINNELRRLNVLQESLSWQRAVKAVLDPETLERLRAWRIANEVK